MSSIRSEDTERKVVLSDVPEEQVGQFLAEAANGALEVGNEAIPNFKQLNDYKSFKAEYAVINGDLVLHFFLPKHAQLNSPEARQAWMSYWLTNFPEKLDSEAQIYFESTYPRLMAKYTSEVASWWFKAQGFGDVLDAGAFVAKFLDQLDASLQARG